MYLHTQLTIFRAPKGIEVSFAVHYHTEFSPTGHFGNWLAVVHYLKRKDSRLSDIKKKKRLLKSPHVGVKQLLGY